MSNWQRASSALLICCLTVPCCDQVERLIDRNLPRRTEPHQLSDGTIVTEIDTEFCLVFGEERVQFAGIDYCPFCSGVVSRELWNLEKRK